MTADWGWLADALIEVTEDPNTFQPTEHADYWRWVAESVAARDDWPLRALDVDRMADAIHAKMCGPFTTVDPQQCLHGRQRDETLATILIAEYDRLSTFVPA